MAEYEKRIFKGKRNFIIALVLLLMTNVAMGIVLIQMSKHSLREQMNGRILDVANIASSMLDGDDIEMIAGYDKSDEEYMEAFQLLRHIQNNIKLDYIYVVRETGENNFTFVIDPDEESPAQYGSKIESTDALVSASKGRASVEQVPHTDDWGTFYSAYSPVFDSSGNVVGIVGVDFSADWYDGNLRDRRFIVVIITMVALIIGIILSFIIASENRKRFEKMKDELKAFDEDMKKLEENVIGVAVKRLNALPEKDNYLLKMLAQDAESVVESQDENENIISRISGIHEKVERFVKFIDSNVYYDDLTNVMNKAKYKIAIKELDESIENGKGNFSVAFFDINGLNAVNTLYGFEVGDVLMRESADILIKVFGRENIYRVAGDEFIALMKEKTAEDMEKMFKQFDGCITALNSDSNRKHTLAVAKGFDTYVLKKHDNYREVFTSAKTNMEKNKAEYYEKLY